MTKVHQSRVHAKPCCDRPRSNMWLSTACTEAELDALAADRDHGTLVCVGDTIFAEGQEEFLRGHGTITFGNALRATQCGVVHQVNKLITIQSLQQRYTAELGDVVVGRVTEIKSKRWKLDLQSRQEAFLMLSAVNLPGGIQRRRTVEDELNMRTVYEEGDLISAEVQSLYHDGSVALQTRTSKYGKLKDGVLLNVRSSLVPRQRQHFCGIGKTGVNAILGVNGLIWLSPDPNYMPVDGESEELLPRKKVARVANCIRLLAELLLPITPVRINEIYQESLSRSLSICNIVSQDLAAVVLGREAAQRATIDH